MEAAGGCCYSKTISAQVCGRNSFSALASLHISLSARPRPTFGGGVWGTIRRLDSIIPLRNTPPRSSLSSSTFLSLQDGCVINEVDCGSPETSESTIRVRFVLRRKCLFGEQFFVVGEDPVLGSWEPSEAVPMNWSEDHLWTAEQDLSLGCKPLFKFILKGDSSVVEWQPGPDRVLALWNTSRTIIVEEDWHSPEFQRAFEELSENNPAIHLLLPEAVNCGSGGGGTSSVNTEQKPALDEMIDQSDEAVLLVPGSSSMPMSDVLLNTSAIVAMEQLGTVVHEPLDHSSHERNDQFEAHHRYSPTGNEEPTIDLQLNEEEGFPSAPAFNMEKAAAVFKNDVDWSLRHLAKLFSSLGFHYEQLD